ncbi:MAG: hypothetical protein KUG73_02130, partial [Pseudomonadales bacterium]|nr:hypothetical protein [Pseudomonadales bacterium]
PGWILLNEAGLIHHIEPEQIKPIKNPSFHAAYELLLAKQNNNETKELEARKVLKDINSLLLTVYLKIA